MIIKDISEQLIVDGLSDYLNTIENRRSRERDYLLDFYEGINVDHYVKEYFGSESLQQVPIFTQNLTRRVCKARGKSYARPVRMSVDERYREFADIQDLNAKRKQLEQTTFLLGTQGFRSLWNARHNRVEYDILSHMEPIFLEV